MLSVCIEYQYGLKYYDICQLVTSENRVIGSRTYTDEDFLTSIKMIEEEKVDLESIISSEESFENDVEVFIKL